MGIQMHLTTVFLAGGLLSVLVVVSLAFFAASRPTFPGFRRWMAAVILVEVGIAVIGFQGRWIDALPLLLGKGAILLGAILLYDGLGAFLGRPRRWSWHLLALLAWVAIFLVFHFVHWSTDYRGELISLMLGVYSGIVIYRYFRWIRKVYGENWFMLVGFFLSLCLAGLLLVYTALYGKALGELPVPPTLHSLYVIAAFTSSVLIGFGLIVLNSQRNELELQKAGNETHGLGGLVTMCASCRRVTEDHVTWISLEVYIARRTDIKFSHTICPDCAQWLYPGFSVSK